MQSLRDEDLPLADRARKEYLEKGVPKPPDGPKVKQDQTESCLTCIRIGKICHGTEVEGGRCRQCRGDSGDTRTRRGCLWLDPENNIFTYEDAFEASNSKRNPHNTKEGREARTKRKEAAAKAPSPPQLIEDLASWPAALRLLREAACEVDTESAQDENTVLVGLFNAVASRNFAAGDIDSLPDRQVQVTAQQVILQTLRRMKLLGIRLSADDVRGLANQEGPDISGKG